MDDFASIVYFPDFLENTASFGTHGAAENAAQIAPPFSFAPAKGNFRWGCAPILFLLEKKDASRPVEEKDALGMS